RVHIFLVLRAVTIPSVTICCGWINPSGHKNPMPFEAFCRYKNRMKKLPFTLMAGVGALALASALTAAVAQSQFSELSAARYLKDVTYLASDALKGRGNGTPELELAANYIAEQFKQAGLKPAGENGTYLQPFEVTTGAQFGPKNELRIGTAALKRDDDFVPMMISNTAEADAPLVFVGYGITAPEYKYDDYAGVDVNGKIVVAFRYEPQ